MVSFALADKSANAIVAAPASTTLIIDVERCVLIISYAILS
jgi:hypothetical protein